MGDSFEPEKPVTKKPVQDGFEPDGFEPEHSDLVAKGLTGLAAAGKGLDYLGGATRAVAAGAAGAVMGKKLYTWQELKQAMDPRTTKRFPDASELMGRAGVAAGGQLSDVLPGPYAEPGSEHPWYQPEKGGHLDPTARGAGGFVTDVALDPLTWLSLGASGAAKKAALEESSRAIAKPASTGVVGDALSMASHAGDQAANVLTMPAQAVKKGNDTLGKIPVIGAAPRALQTVATMPSDAVRAVSRKIYRSGVKPIALAGEQGTQPHIVDTMMEAGIHGNPNDVAAGMKSSARDLKGMRDQVLAAADETGPLASKEAAFDPMFQELQQLVQDQRLTSDEAARILQETSAAKASGGDLVNTQLMSQWKTDTTKALPSSTWNELAARSPDLAQQVKGTLGTGFKNETQRAVDEGVSHATGGKITDAGTNEMAGLDSQLGDLINKPVRRAAKGMASAYEKKPTVSMDDLKLMMIAGGAGELASVAGHTHMGPEAAILAFLASKGIDIGTSTAAKTGAGLLGNRLMKSAVVAPALDAGVRRTMINKFNPYEFSPLEIEGSAPKK